MPSEAPPAGGQVERGESEAGVFLTMNIFLGIDVGSISTNMVALDAKQNIVADLYLRTEGAPIDAIQKSLNQIKERLPNDVEVVGVSKDSVTRHDKFKEKHDLKMTLASDEESDMIERYGSWVEKNMYGRKYMGIERSTFLIDEKGVVREVWRKVKVKGHVDAVLEAARAL